MPLNTDILTSVRDLLEVRPELVNMMASGYIFDNTRGNNLYKLVGYIAKIKPLTTPDQHWNSVCFFGECTKVLGLTQDESYRLFHSYEWPILGKLLRELHDPKTLKVTDANRYAAIVCKYLTWFIREYPNVC